MTIKSNNFQVGLDTGAPATNNWSLDAVADGTLKIQQGNIGGTPTTKMTLSGTDVSLPGNLAFTGTGNRITGDFSNGTVASRVVFQTSTTDSNTVLTAIPNGTATSSFFSLCNNSTPTNASTIQLSARSTTVDITAGRNGSGTYLPLGFFTSGTKYLEISTAGLCTAYNGLTVSGAAFTSRGITDNATGTRLTLAESSMALSFGSQSNSGSGYGVTVTGISSKATATNVSSFALFSNDALASNPLQLSIVLNGNPTSGSRNATIDVGEYGTGTGHDLVITSVTEKVRIASDGTTTLGGTSTAPAFKVTPNSGLANWLRVEPRASTGAPILWSEGTDSTVGIELRTKTTGSDAWVTFIGGTGSANSVAIKTNSSHTNYLTLTGSNGGNPTIGTSAGYLAITPQIVATTGIQCGSRITSPAAVGSITTSAVTIYTLVYGSNGTLVIVQGDNGTNYFMDLVTFGNSGSVTAIASTTTYGSPPARTYSVVGTALKVAMASGSGYTVRCQPFEFPA
jgi:hypothetical protein